MFKHLPQCRLRTILSSVIFHVGMYIAGKGELLVKFSCDAEKVSGGVVVEQSTEKKSGLGDFKT